VSENLFFAVFPDAETAQRISEFSERFRNERALEGRVIARQRLHVTLAFLGNRETVSDLDAQAAGRAGASVRLAPFDVLFDRIDSFSGREGHKPLILRADDGVDGLRRLRSELDRALPVAGVKPPTGGYEPHVTLSYADQAVEMEPLEAPFRWTVSHFALVRSLVGQARYIPLDRWRLDG
jgi:2'-5' RNA ligase